MKDLIAALMILTKYGDPVAPTHCEHDELQVMIEADNVPQEDKDKLDALGFFENAYGTFSSFRYGSA